MSQRQALELALEFCEFLWRDVAMNQYTEEYRNRVEDAIRAALKEPEPGSYHGWVTREVLFDNGEPIGHREPTQEPVAKVELMMTGGNAGLATRIVEIDDHLRERLRPGQMLYTHPAPQRQPQEPVAYRYWSTKWHSWEYSDAPPVFPAVPAGTKVEPLYTHPAPQRQPFSDEKIMDLVCDMSIQMRWPSTPLDIARAIERAHEIGVQDE